MFFNQATLSFKNFNEPWQAMTAPALLDLFIGANEHQELVLGWYLSTELSDVTPS